MDIDRYMDGWMDRQIDRQDRKSLIKIKQNNLAKERKKFFNDPNNVFGALWE